MKSLSIKISVGICILLIGGHIVRVSLFLFPRLLEYCAGNSDAQSINIIGGADGPVAIYITSSLAFVSLLPVFECIGLVFVVITLFRCIQYQRAG